MNSDTLAQAVYSAYLKSAVTDFKDIEKWWEIIFDVYTMISLSSPAFIALNQSSLPTDVKKKYSEFQLDEVQWQPVNSDTLAQAVYSAYLKSAVTQLIFQNINNGIRQLAGRIL